MTRLEVSRSMPGRNHSEQYDNLKRYLRRIGYQLLSAYLTQPNYTVYAKKIGDQDGNAG